jgi:hypothetical protein
VTDLALADEAAELATERLCRQIIRRHTYPPIHLGDYGLVERE